MAFESLLSGILMVEKVLKMALSSRDAVPDVLLVDHRLFQNPQ